MITSFKGAAKRIEDVDIPRCASEIGVGEDVMHGVMDTESAGSGFDSQGRPKALYEPHIAYKLSRGAVRAALVKAGLAYPKQGTKPYPKESYTRIAAASKIAGVVAYLATSWGAFQIMGFNAALAGYTSVEEMIEAFKADEENHLQAAVGFIKNAGLDDELRAIEKIIATRPLKPAEAVPFVRGYNGSGYARNAYHTKFAKSVNRWRKIRDTPVGETKPAAPRKPPRPAEPKTPERSEADDVYSSETMIQLVQEKLTDLGYPLGSRNPKTGKFDGKIGTLTKSSIRDFRADNGLPEGEGIDAELVAALEKAKPRELSPEREKASTEKAAENAPETAANWRTEVIAKYGSAGMAFLALLDWITKQFAAGEETIRPYLDMVASVPLWIWLLAAAAILAALAWNHYRGRVAGVEAWRTGARL